MADKEVIWSNRANAELTEILQFYIQRNKSNTYSLKLLEEIDSMIEKIVRHNFIGRLTKDGNARVVILKAYLIFYDIRSTEIHILSIWDSRQNPEKTPSSK